MLPFNHVAGLEFPVLVRVVESCQETPFLFLPGNIEPEFDDYGAVAREMLFVLADRVQPIVPDSLEVELSRYLL